jgi:NAD(P)H-quinone oxidoreductase subunit 5
MCPLKKKMSILSAYFYLDTLSIIMLVLIGFVSLIVTLFSLRHLKGDRLQGTFLASLIVLILTVLALVVADNLLVFLIAWAVSNLALTRLMIHKASWKQAHASGMLALKNFGIGFGALSTAFALLYIQTGLTSIHQLISATYDPIWLSAILVLLLVAALTQSAIWPFHSWLTSSLNSPTVVSAFMHAGLVNGGGFLLARFAPLSYMHTAALPVLFSLGLATAMLGTVWKLMQSDVKRMLACSTMGQMGFMIVQCGLGLYSAAIAHLCWHGLFKANLFLSSGSAAQEKRLDLGYPPPMKVFLLSLLCGVCGAAAFVVVSQKNVAAADTTLFLVGLTFMASAQAAIPLLMPSPYKRLLLVAPLVAGLGGLYGLSVHGIESALASSDLMKPQPLGVLHVLGFAVLAIFWLTMLFARPFTKLTRPPAWLLRYYVVMLNMSQPNPKTITTHRNQYRYL